MERTTSQYTTMKKLALLLLIASSFLASKHSMAQSLTGEFADVCPDRTYVYTISYPPGSACSVDPSNLLTCTGCYSASRSSDNNSISLKWSSTAPVWQLNGKVNCHDPDNVNVVTSKDLFMTASEPVPYDLPLLTCPGESTTTYTHMYNFIQPSIGDCTGTTHTWAEVVSGSVVVYPWSSTSQPLDQTSGNGGVNDSQQGLEAIGHDLDHSAVKVYWNSGFAGEVTIIMQYKRRTHNISGCHLDDDPSLQFQKKFYRNVDDPNATFDAPANVTPIGSTAQVNFSVHKGNNSYTGQPYFGKIYGARYYRNSTLVIETSSCAGVESDLSFTYGVDLSTLPTDGSNDIVFTAQVKDQCGVWWDAGSETVHISPQCVALIGFEDQMKVGVTGGDDSETPGQFLIDNGTPYAVNFQPPPSLPTYTLAKLLQDYTLSNDFGTQGTFSSNTVTINREIGSYHVFFTKMDGRSNCPDVGLALRLNGKDWTLDKAGCPVIIPEAFDDAALDFHLVSGSYVFENFAGTIKSKSYIEVHPGVTLTSGAELELEPGVPQPTGDNNINFVENVNFDEYGRIRSAGRTYFDNQGKQTQAQSKNLAADVVLATQTIYDAFGRAAISTLPAPVRVREGAASECPELSDNGLVFDFVDKFVTKSSTPYSSANFDLAKESNPDAVDNSVAGTLGWYYSANNGNATGDDEKLNEPFTPISGYPYDRTLWLHDGTNQVTGNTSPGDAFKAGGGNVATSNSSAVSGSDPIIVKYFDLYDEVITRPTSLGNQFYKIETFDADENKSVVYMDKAGKGLVSLYYGTGSSVITKSYNIYDNVDRLVVSVPPNGVAAFENTTPTPYNDIEKTTYKYNQKGWLVEMNEPNSGLTQYMYRNDGKIRFSQNAKQAVDEYFSYTNYDRAGRPVESGEFHPNGSTLGFKTQSLMDILENVTTGGLTENGKVFVTSTFYDLSAHELPVDDDAGEIVNLGRKQRFVQGAVSCSFNENVKTWYSYDERGRVEWVVQQLKDESLSPEERIKTLDYRYGPSGGLQEVVYQKNVDDETFTHYYEYDYSGKLLKTYTAYHNVLEYKSNGELNNPGILTLQSTQYYYKHGPIKRVVYADNVQGIDYLYTISGALKSINDASKTHDPGDDGNDVFGMTLDYYSGDYATNGHTPTSTTYTSETDSHIGLVKGNTWHSPIEANKTVGYGYTYDSRLQFNAARWTDGTPGIPSNAYKESVPDYDLNGNIGHLNRYNRLGIGIATFAYNYSDKPNQLSSIANSGNPFRTYEYTEIGEMKRQVDEVNDKGMNVSYDVAGRVIEVKDDDDKLITTYTYDDRGFRHSKISYNEDGDPILKSWYVRDASGAIVGAYEKNIQASQPIALTELPVYSGSRIGMYKPQFDFTFFEMQDHLGNVRAVIGCPFPQEYLATLEDSRVNANEESDFSGMTPVTAPFSYVNHTPSSVTVNRDTYSTPSGSKVIRINNSITQQPIGGGIMLWVHPGDKIDASVYAKYQTFGSSTEVPITGLASYLLTAFSGLPPVVDQSSLFTGLNSPGGTVFAPLASFDEAQPKAFLSYILYDKDMIPLKTDHDQMSTAAKIPTSNQSSHPHEKLSIDDLEIEREGFIFIYVSNESSQNMDVYFDDLYVKHTYSNIVAGGDYYPFGLEISDRTITREKYRHGYQGLYSEKDEETGWNHFQLREYDAVVGRWLSVDPAGQYWSPFVGMGNNPSGGVDPDGGYNFLEALFKSGFGLRGRLSSSGSRDDGGRVWGYVTENEEGNAVFNFGDDARIYNTPMNQEIDAMIQRDYNQILLSQMSTYDRIMITRGGDAIEPVQIEFEIILAISSGGASAAARGAEAASSSAHLATEGANLASHLRQLEKYGETGFKSLENGRIRYYGALDPAKSVGEMVGRRTVREWNPAKNGFRTWLETLDASGTVRIVRPQIGAEKVHFMFNASGKFVKTF
jgi:RHS repeat-associated protein